MSYTVGQKIRATYWIGAVKFISKLGNVEVIS